jgi:hypothetical protein
MPRWITAAVVGLASAALLAGGATAAAKKEKPAKFPQVLAGKLGKELNKPADAVLAALKAAPKPAKGEKPTTKEQRQARQAAARKFRANWAAAVGKSLDVPADRVTAAVRALVKQRLDSLVEDGWLTPEQAAKRQDKLWIGFLRIR